MQLARAKRQLFLERRLLSAKTAPIVNSSIFALKNAAPDDWRDKQEIEHGGEVKYTRIENVVVDPKGGVK